jgi:putative nucleotidyltransferase with HDIG domain
VDSIEIKNGTKIPDTVIRPFLKQPVGQVLDPKRMQGDLSRIYGLGYFESLDYHTEKREENKHVMVVDAPRKSWGPDYLKLGLKISEGFNGDSIYGILIRYQMTEINSMGAEFQADGEIGTNFGARAEFYQPVGHIPHHESYGAPYFLFTDAGYGNQNDPLLLSDNNQIPFEVKSGWGNLGAGRNMGRWGRTKIGLGWQDNAWRTPTAPAFHFNQTIGDVFLRLGIDTLDKPGFPRLGMVGKLEARAASESLGADVSTAKKGGLLHDIGKVIDAVDGGNHVTLGVEYLKKNRFPQSVIHCVEAHHEDIPFESVEAMIVYIADAISGSRPGARHEDFEDYLKRIRTIEDAAKTKKGVKDAYALQAGRELRVIVRPEDVTDDEMTVLAQQIREELESKFEVFPGQIKVTVIRESRAEAVTKI